MGNFLLAVLIVLLFVLLLFLAIVALCVIVIIRDDHREKKHESKSKEIAKTKPTPEESVKIKQFENLMKYDGTKQPPIRKENE